MSSDLNHKVKNIWFHVFNLNLNFLKPVDLILIFEPQYDKTFNINPKWS